MVTLYMYLYIKALPRKDAKKMENHLFRLYDTNNDGSIGFTEFMVIIRRKHIFIIIEPTLQLVYLIMTEGTPQEVLTRIFRVFDVNRLECPT